MRGRPKSFTIELTADEQTELELITRRTTVAVGLYQRAQAILLLAEELPEYKVAERVGLGNRIVRKWAKRYQELRLAGLGDKKGRGRKPVFSP